MELYEDVVLMVASWEKYRAANDIKVSTAGNVGPNSFDNLYRKHIEAFIGLESRVPGLGFMTGFMV